MIICPMCKKVTQAGEPRCPRCDTDVSLLHNYVNHLRQGLDEADKLTRAGELGDAVWAYLEVLEIDPDNATARRQVGKVATAVRQFDEMAPGRRWLRRLKSQTRFRRWVSRMQEDEGDLAGWLSSLFWILLVLAALVLGYALGQPHATPPTTKPPTTQPTSQG
jgi:hypothetical protein